MINAFLNRADVIRKRSVKVNGRLTLWFISLVSRGS